jgi:6-phosphogluconolactonase
MNHELTSLPDPDAVAQAGARFVAERARSAVADRGVFQFAVSGGHTPWAMFAALAGEEVAWDAFVIYQVDERVAPPGDPSRNLTHLSAALGTASPTVLPMPVNDADLTAAAAAYATDVPVQFDLVHLGLGADGHTASLIPGDPVLSVTDRLVAVTGPYQGNVRMTLTYPALARARQLLWLVTGADKKKALSSLLAGDKAIPAGRVQAAASLVLADEAAT